MSRAYNFHKNHNPQPVGRKVVESYEMTFVYHDNIKAFLENDESKLHQIKITCGNIPDACGLFHEAVKKLFPSYYISNISTYPVIKEESNNEKAIKDKT